MTTVIREVLEIHRETLQERGIDVVVLPSLPHFTFQRALLTQLFQNLITNAAKFMGEQKDPRIEIGGKVTDDCYEFFIRDNGVGIDLEYQKKIFEVFHRLKEVEVDGTGLGLSIVRKIVNFAGGDVRVQSKKGEGATFFLEFPKTGAKVVQKSEAFLA